MVAASSRFLAPIQRIISGTIIKVLRGKPGVQTIAHITSIYILYVTPKFLYTSLSTGRLQDYNDSSALNLEVEAYVEGYVG